MNGTTTPQPLSESPFVSLVSSDGFEFHLRRSAVMRSSVLRNMLNPDSAFLEAKDGVCHLSEISGVVLEKVAEYFYYQEKHRDNTGVPDMDIPAELCLELLIAADFLDTIRKSGSDAQAGAVDV